MAATKPTSIKQAIAQFEAAKSTEAAKVVAAAAEKVRSTTTGCRTKQTKQAEDSRWEKKEHRRSNRCI